MKITEKIFFKIYTVIISLICFIATMFTIRKN
jgi:hypothetical protein